MPKPGENKTVQSRILTYAQEIGWKFVPRDEAETRRGFNDLELIFEKYKPQMSVHQLHPKYCID